MIELAYAFMIISAILCIIWVILKIIDKLKKRRS